MNIPENRILEEPGKVTLFYGSVKRCYHCGKQPWTIYYSQALFRTYYRCIDCNKETYKPKTVWQKFCWFFDKHFI